MMKKNRAGGLVVLLLMVALMTLGLTGCGSSKTDAEKSDQATDEESKTATKLVRFAMANTPYLDPAVGSDEASSAIFPNVYDTLVFPQADGSVKPWLASDWTVSEDGLVWDFTLRSDVKFHNGDELTADDVVFSMKRLVDIGEGFGYLFQGRVKDVAAVDKTHVRFTFDKPFGPFLNTLPRLYVLNKNLVTANTKPDGAYGENGDYGKDWLNAHDAGSGPYQVKEFKVNDSLVCDRFTDYWGGFDPNNPDQFKLIPDPEPVTCQTMLSRQELEISSQFQPQESYAVLDNLDGVDVTSLFCGSTMALTMNNTMPPMDDIHFRKAMAYLVDYDTITTSISPGAKRAASFCTSIVPGSSTTAFTYPHDMDKALAELKQSKYYSKLADYPVDLIWPAGCSDREKGCLMIQADAAKIGIKANVVKLPWLSLVEAATKPETTPMCAYLLTTPSYAEAGSQLEASYKTKEVGSWETMVWYQDPSIDERINDAMSTIDAQERYKKYEEMQNYIMESVPEIPLVEVPEQHAYQSTYLEWEAAEAAKLNQPIIPVMGYYLYMKDIKVYPEKMK